MGALQTFGRKWKMNYFTRISDRLIFRLINYGILLHASLCIAAIGMVVAAPFVVLDLFHDIQLTNELTSDAEINSVPLVNRSEERGDAQTGKYLCFVELPNSESSYEGGAVRMATPFLRSIPPSELISLQIYSHPALIDPSAFYPKIVEVPVDHSWKSVFQIGFRRFTTA